MSWGAAVQLIRPAARRLLPGRLLNPPGEVKCGTSAVAHVSRQRYALVSSEGRQAVPQCAGGMPARGTKKRPP